MGVNILDPKGNMKDVSRDDLLGDFIKCFDNPSGKRVLEHLKERASKNFPDIMYVNNTYYMAGHMGNVKYIENVLKYAMNKSTNDKKKKGVK